MKFNPVVTAIVVIYLLIMLFIGWYSSKKITSNTDFMVAGRRLGPFLMAGTLAATEIGGGSSLGVVQQGMESHGLSAAWYIITMGLAFIILTFLAPKFRAATVKTVPEYFRRRYGKSAGIVTAVIMLLPLVGVTASQFIASSVILSTMLGISYKTAVIIVVVVVTAYSIMGGLWSVTLTDFVQVFLIVIGMIIAVPFALNRAGGWDSVVANVPPETFDLFKGYSPMAVISLTIMYVATFTVGQEAVSRYYAARDGKSAQQGSILAALVNFIYASMSSSDSDLLGAGSIFANDIYHAVLKPSASSGEVMRVTQVTMAIVGVAAGCIALFNTSSIVSILMFCFTLRAAGAFFPYVLGHYWKGASLAGTIASLISGTVIVVYLEKISGNVLFGMKVSQPIVPGLVVALVFFLVFSKMFPPRNQTTELAYEEE